MGRPVWIHRWKILSSSESTFLDAVLQLLSLKSPCCNKALKISKYFGNDFIDFTVETCSLSNILEKIVNFIEFAQNVFEFLFGFLVSFVLFVKDSRNLSSLFGLGFEFDNEFVVLFDHFVDLTEYFLKDFFLLSSNSCILEVFICLIFVVDLCEELLYVICQVVQFFFFGFDRFDSLSQSIEILRILFQKLCDFHFWQRLANCGLIFVNNIDPFS